MASSSVLQQPKSSTLELGRPNEDFRTVFRIPDLLPVSLLKGTPATWPCTSPPHPLQQTMTVESLDWVRSLNIMSEKKLAKFAKYEIMTITAWAYRRVSPIHFRLCADFMHLFWIFDDRTDEQTSAEVEREIANVKRVLDDPSLISPDQGVLEGVCQPFWRMAVDELKPPPATKKRFFQNFISFLGALAEEARDRETGRFRTYEEYLALRRRNIGLLPSLDFGYISSELSDEVYDHEIVQRMSIAANYNVEQAGGQKCVAQNLVDIVLRERQKGLQDAIDVVGASYRELFLSLIDDYNKLPTFDEPEQNEALREYAMITLDWVEANIEFSLNSQRYFGAKAGSEELRTKRWVELLPLKG